MPEFDVLPNRFVAASEDSERVYYQAVARFRPQVSGACARCGMDGGLAVSKKRADLVNLLSATVAIVAWHWRLDLHWRLSRSAN